MTWRCRTKLQCLDLYDTNVSDTGLDVTYAGLVHLKGLTKLH